MAQAKPDRSRHRWSGGLARGRIRLEEAAVVVEKLDLEKVAVGIGGKCKGKVNAGPGYFGAMQVASERRKLGKLPPVDDEEPSKK